MTAPIGVVVIGRNEGERLVRCLESAAGASGTESRLVYVDSGSTDGSVERARALGARVIELDPRTPFTAARARNAGFELLVASFPEVELVQFLDGDCEIVPEWWRAVAAWLPGDPRTAVICGRRRERFRAASIYNRLCDMEWDTPLGEAVSCGGDALMRVGAILRVGGFDPALIAGEEPEICFRLRALGYRIERIASEMTLHDAAMSRFSQWWRRSLRAGHAYAENAALHGSSDERFRMRELRSIMAWGAALPLFALGFAPLSRGASLLVLLAYGLLFLRVRAAKYRGEPAAGDANAYALFVVIAKWAQACGVVWYWANRLRGRRSGLIEYKGAR